MDSKFSQVLKIKKQKLDDIEIRLFNARASKTSLEGELAQKKQELGKEEFPKSGNFALLQSVLAVHEAMLGEISRLKEQILMAQNQINQLETLHKEAFKDHEKIKYLHENEVKLMLDKIKKKTAAELDEISVMGYFRRHKNEKNY